MGLKLEPFLFALRVLLKLGLHSTMHGKRFNNLFKLLKGLNNTSIHVFEGSDGIFSRAFTDCLEEIF